MNIRNVIISALALPALGTLAIAIAPAAAADSPTAPDCTAVSSTMTMCQAKGDAELQAAPQQVSANFWLY